MREIIGIVSELAGNPFLNFFISVLVELVAILVSHYAFEKFGRKWPYFINMFISGFALLFVLFVPKGNFKRTILFSNVSF